MNANLSRNLLRVCCTQRALSTNVDKQLFAQPCLFNVLDRLGVEQQRQKLLFDEAAEAHNISKSPTMSPPSLDIKLHKRNFTTTVQQAKLPLFQLQHEPSNLDAAASKAIHELDRLGISELRQQRMFMEACKAPSGTDV